MASLIPILLVFTISTYPDEWLDQLKVVPVIGEVHELLVSGDPDEVTSRPFPLFSKRLVLTDQSLNDADKLDKIDVSHSFRGRNPTASISYCSRSTTIWRIARAARDVLVHT
jgi:hypothetical protein